MNAVIKFILVIALITNYINCFAVNNDNNKALIHIINEKCIYLFNWKAVKIIVNSPMDTCKVTHGLEFSYRYSLMVPQNGFKDVEVTRMSASRISRCPYYVGPESGKLIEVKGGDVVRCGLVNPHSPASCECRKIN